MCTQFRTRTDSLKTIVEVSFFKTVLYTHIHQPNYFQYLESFKHEHPSICIYLCPVNLHCYISTAQTDIRKTYRTFSLKINKFHSFSKITQAWQCLKIVFMRRMSSHTEFNLTFHLPCSKREI